MELDNNPDIPLPPPLQPPNNAWAVCKQSLFQLFQQPPYSLHAALAQAIVEQIGAQKTSLTGPGPDFGAKPRVWAERVLVARQGDLVAPPASPQSFEFQRQPSVDPQEAERVVSALQAILPTPVLQQVLEKLNGEIAAVGQKLRRLEELNNMSAAYPLQDNDLAELQLLRDSLTPLLNEFLQLARDAAAAFRFAANVLVLLVQMWAVEQRRLANRAETREKRKQQGHYVKALPALRRELNALALHVKRFGALLVSSISQVRTLQGSLPRLIPNPVDVHNVHQLLETTYSSIVSVLPLLAERSLVIVHQPLQVLKKGNLFAFKVHWLAGPVVAQFGVRFPTLRARLVPEREQTGAPDFNSPTGLKAAHLKGNTSQLLGSNNAAAGRNAAGHQPGHHTAWEAKFSGLMYETPGRADKNKRGKKGQQAEKEAKAAEEEEDEADDDDNSIHNGIGARCAPKSRVTERLHFLVVESDPIVDLSNVQLRAVSLPMVLTVSVIQECFAMCTVMWRNAFGRQDDVPWSALRDELSALFEGRTTVCNRERENGHPTRSSQVVPGRGIPLEQLEYVRQRFNGAWVRENGSGADARKAAAAQNGNLRVNYRDFMFSTVKELPRRDKPTEINEFSVWSYLYSALKLLLDDKELTTRLWVDGLIYGFVSKDQARDLLREHVGSLKTPASAMLVRYAEKLEGAVCIVRFMPNANGGVVDVVEPWDRPALKKLSLFQRLLNKSTNQRPAPEPDDFILEKFNEKKKLIQLILTYPRDKPLNGLVNGAHNKVGVASGGPVIPEKKPAANTLKAMQPQSSALVEFEEADAADDYVHDNNGPVQIVSISQLIRIGEQG